MKHGKRRQGKKQRERKARTSDSSAASGSPARTGESAEAAQGQESRIKLKFWWERWKGRLEYELDELKSHGIRCERDEEAFANGAVIIKLWFPAEGEETIALTAHYPDTYPYTRFEVKAQELVLDHHLAPFDKNLCLMGQATENWDTDNTLYKVLKDKLKDVLKTGRSDDLDEAAVLEEEQGEPISFYYPYLLDSIVLIDSDWSLNTSDNKGELTIGVKKDAETTLRGAVLEVKDNSSQTLIQGNPSFKKIYPNQLNCRWVRLDEIIGENNPGKFFEKLCEQFPFLKKPKWNNIKRGNIDVIGIIFPEELGWRKSSDGWMFLVRAATLIENKPQEIFYFARTGRAGRTDLSARIPEVSSIANRKAAVIGLGGVGWASALELARNGIGELRIDDDDTVEPGTTVRWAFGLPAAGRIKVDAIKEFIDTNYPYTKVIPYIHRIGSALNETGSDLKVLGELFDGVDLIYDASAEVGIQQLLSDLAAEQNVPYICVSTRQGAWGGEVARIRPEETKGCWMCLQHSLKDGTIPAPPSDTEKMFQPAGCASPTFTGVSFDIQEVSLCGVRLAVSTLSENTKGTYPKADWDVSIVYLRENKNELIAPKWKTYPLNPHPLCSCQKKSA